MRSRPIVSFVAALALAAGVVVPACRRASRGIVVLCAGDSLTERGYPRPLRALLRAAGVRARVVNYGRSGATSGEYLAFLRRAGDRMAAERPDFVLVMLGTNDVRADSDRTSRADFALNLREIVATVSRFPSRSGRPARVLLAVPPPVPEGTPAPFDARSPARLRDEIAPEVRRLAAERRLPLVDALAAFAGAPELLPEVHPTPAGYERMARAWLAALLPDLPRGSR